MRKSTKRFIVLLATLLISLCAGRLIGGTLAILPNESLRLGRDDKLNDRFGDPLHYYFTVDNIASFHYDEIEWRTYHQFELRDFAPVVSAKLRFTVDNVNQGTAPELFVYDVDRINREEADWPATFDDLGTGELYGTAVFGNIEGDVSAEIDLAPAAISAINSSAGDFAVGLRADVMLVAGVLGTRDYELVLITVPESHAPHWCGFCALGTLACIRERNRLLK